MHIILGILVVFFIIYHFHIIGQAILFLGFIAVTIYIIASNERFIGWILVALACIIMLFTIGIGIYKLISLFRKNKFSSKINSSSNQIIETSPRTYTNNNSQSTTDFRAKYPFVMVNVNPSLQTQFIHECEWLESRLGHFPSEADQVAILKSLGETSVL